MVRIEIRGSARSERTQMQELPPFFRDFFGPEFQQRPRPVRGLGSGVIVDPNGYILTNNHVVENADRIAVTLSAGREVTGTLVGADPPTDLAVVKIDEENLPTLPFGDSDAARVGDVVLAVGYPFGNLFDRSVTMGIISGRGRTTARGPGVYEDFLQTDAPINTGNSGGALINTRGELIGIPTQIWSPTGGNIGIGFAIPSNMAKNIMDQLVQTGKVRRARLGVYIGPVSAEMAEAMNLPSTHGALVQEVQPDTPAERAGIQQGDVIIGFNGHEIRDHNELMNLVASQQPGTKAEVTFTRSGKEQTASVTLSELELEGETSRAERTGESEGGRLGLTVEPLTPELRRQLDATRDTGVVVSGVDPDGPAAEKGLQRGDIIYEVNRKPVASPRELRQTVAEAGSNAVLLLTSRDGQERLVAVRPVQ